MEAAPLAAAVAHAITAVAQAAAALPAEQQAALAAAVAAESGPDSGSAASGQGLEEQLQLLRQAGQEVAAAAAAVRAPFAWADGPLVTAMRRGDLILVDEINLAEDAVLERLNRWEREGGGRRTAALRLATCGGGGGEVLKGVACLFMAVRAVHASCADG